MKRSVTAALWLTLTVISVCTAVPARAEPGEFWYGLWGTDSIGPWGPAVYDSMRVRYRMNWTIDRTRSAANLAQITSAGLKTIMWPGGIPNDSALYYRYSDANYIRYEAEGDTVPYYNDPSDLNSGSYVSSYGGAVVTDATADSSINGRKALLFRRNIDTAGSAVWAKTVVLRSRWLLSGQPHNVILRYRIRGTPPASPDTIVAYLRHRERSGSPTYHEIAIRGSDISQTYQERRLSFPLSPDADTAMNWFTEIGLEWTGKDSLWIDWIADTDEDGRELREGNVDDVLKDFVWKWSFFDNPTVVGFWQGEEWYQDAIVYPRKRVDSLMRAQIPRLSSITEDHHLYWWPTRNQYGGITAATANAQKPIQHLSTLSYPFTGYNTQSPTLAPSGLVFTTTKAAVANPPLTCAQVGTDTSVCIQEVMDVEARYFRFYKRFADSLGARFIPIMHALSWLSRPVPTSCIADTSWTVVLRRPNAAETKCHAGVALANGVNGLPYFKYGTTIWTKSHNLGTCFPNPFPYYLIEGLADLPEVQAGLANFVGPFVDSMGHYFAEPGFWLGGGRLDASRDSVGLIDVFDSTARSLTFTQPGDEAFIEAGVYQSGSTQYFLLVNRRAYDATPQEILTWLNPAPGQSSALYYIIDVYSKDTVLAGGMGVSNGQLVPFRTSINPGEFKFFKIVSAGISSVSGSSYPRTWIGRIPVSASVQVDSNKTLTVLGPAEIRVASGGSYAFNVYGSLNVAGIDANSQVTFRSSNLSTPSNQDWYGIKQLGPGNVSLNYVKIKDAYNGLRLVSRPTVDTVSVDHCDFNNSSLAGVWVDVNTNSLISITNSRFSNINNYAIDMTSGKASITGNWFTGAMIHGLKIHGSYSLTTGAKIVSNSFDSLTSNNAYAIYLLMVHNDGFATGDTTVRDNTFGPTWSGQTGQGGIKIVNCKDPGGVRTYRNAIRGGFGLPSYGIFNSSTKTRILGDTTVAESLSAIQDPTYGVYCFSASDSDPDYATIRNVSINAGAGGDFGYCVWVYNNSKVDLGSNAEPGGNALYGWNNQGCGGFGMISIYTLYNNNINFVDSARGNYWGNKMCGYPPVQNTYWPYTFGQVDAGNKLSSNPFESPLGKLVVEGDEQDVAGNVGLQPALQIPGNYPNPFNSATVIELSIGEASSVEVLIYNVLGQQVRTLWNGEMSEGRHLIPWDGRDEHGHSVASGVYFYRVTSPQAQITKKMVVVK